MGTNEEELDDGVVLLSVSAALGEREVVDEEEEVEEPERGAERRWRAGMRREEEGLEAGYDGEEGLVSSVSVGSASSSASSSYSSPLGYSAQEAWTWSSVIGVRLSRDAESASKQ
jgi:hypothetical protein